MSNIFRYHGDTSPIEILVRNPDGTIRDVTGASFILTVNEAVNPADTTHQLFQLTGDIQEPGTDGRVNFPMPYYAADNSGRFFYDIEVTEPLGEVWTLDKGTFCFLQDITKNLDEFLWTPTGTLDSVLVVDGTEFWESSFYDSDDKFVHKVRDDIAVIRSDFDASVLSYGRTIVPFGVQSPFGLSWPYNCELRWKFYLDTCQAYFRATDIRGAFSFLGVGIDHRSGTMSFYSFAGQLDDNNVYSAVSVPPTSVTGWGAGWYEIKLKIEVDGTTFYSLHPSGALTTWVEIVGFTWLPRRTPITPSFVVRENTDVASLCDLAEFEWKRV